MRTVRALHVLVGVAAVVARALHSISDAMECIKQGFSMPQLWINYAAPWLRLGRLYSVHGALMEADRFRFGASALRAGWLPKTAVLPFSAGLIASLRLGLLPTLGICLTLGSAVRNLGLMAMDHAVVFDRARLAA